jgi:hypothetical protein
VGTVNDLAGYDLAFLGDANLDGMEDILVGAPGGGQFAPDLPGQAHLFLSPVQSSMDLAESNAFFTGEHTGTSYLYGYAGATVDGADVNGDGVPDMLVGAEFYSGGHGVAYILHGPLEGGLDVSDAANRILDPSSAYLFTAFSPGDTDGDGMDEVGVLGVDSATLFTLLYNNPPIGELAAADADVQLAASVWPQQTPFDFNQDGYADLWIVDAMNDQEEQDAGAAYVVLGPVNSQTDVVRDAVATFFGTEVRAGTGAGTVLDLNGDGVFDAAVTTGSIQIAGAAYIFHGPLEGSWLLTDAAIEIQGDGDDALSDALAAGDLDGDGLDDLLLSSIKDDDGGEDAGAVWLFYGASLVE